MKQNRHMGETVSEAFNREWKEALHRFAAVMVLEDVNFTFRDEAGREILPHQGVGNSFFEHWIKIEAPYDRRALFFDKFFELAGGFKLGWRSANYLNALRRGDLALKALEKKSLSSKEEKGYFDYCAARARTFLNLARYEEAMEWADMLINAPGLSPVYAALVGDIYYYSGNTEAAHNIYSQLMPPGTLKKSYVVSEMFDRLFSLERGIIPSPVMALNTGRSLNHPEQAEEFWSLAEIEFYDSPQFRESHSRYLVEQGEMMRGFSKLLALVHEMPWLKTASISLENYFSALDPGGKELMPQFRKDLKSRIKANNWGVDGLENIVINSIMNSEKRGKR